MRRGGGQAEGGCTCWARCEAVDAKECGRTRLRAPAWTWSPVLGHTNVQLCPRTHDRGALSSDTRLGARLYSNLTSPPSMCATFCLGFIQTAFNLHSQHPVHPCSARHTDRVHNSVVSSRLERRNIFPKLHSKTPAPFLRPLATEPRTLPGARGGGSARVR